MGDMRFIYWLARWVFALRYRIVIDAQGLEHLKRNQGILFLPNHTSLLDPFIFAMYISPYFQIRPVVVEYGFRFPILNFFFKKFKAVPIPNFDNAVNQFKIKKAQMALDEVVQGLKRGENFLFIPSGRLKKTGKEVIGGASGVYSLLQAYPNMQTVLIRMTGFWGSRFSRALTGQVPGLGTEIFKGVIAVLKNCIFFTPRRKIVIEIEAASLPYKQGRIELNRFLEDWYNRYPDEQGNISPVEPIKLVSLSVWRREMPEIKMDLSKFSRDAAHISEKTRTLVYAEISRILGQSSMKISPEMNLATDLGMDSLNIAELMVFLSRHAKSTKIPLEEIEKVEDVLEIAEGCREFPPNTQKTVTWPKEEHRPPIEIPPGPTLTDAFLQVCKRMGSHPAVGDDFLGVLTYKQMRRAVLVLAEYFKSLPEKHIAILLPACASAYITVFAIEFAGKIPVMLNWTLGPRYLEQMMAQSGAKTVISSWNFIDRLPFVDFGKTSDQIQFLEDIVKNISLQTKVRALIRSVPLRNIDENDPAVILFTSGTENIPKGVPLSHKNLLSHLTAMQASFPVKETDIVYSILPPFHSLGFSIVGIAPILGAMKVAFFPDPTDGFSLAEGIQRWKITHIWTAPTFLKGIFSAAKKEQLATVQVFLCGGEKTPQELYEQAKKLAPEAQLVEGYGVTECSPGIAIGNLIHQKGVGRVIPSLDIITIHPETKQLLPYGTEGEVCVSGPTVFNGYLGNFPSPFIELEGRNWFKTGDIGYLDKEGNLYLSGRLKRFVKIGGEMISLMAVENALTQEFVEQNKNPIDLPVFAICSSGEEMGKPSLILFTKVSLDREKANEILRSAGFSPLVKISRVEKIHEFPLMGAGKINYRLLLEKCNK